MFFVIPFVALYSNSISVNATAECDWGGLKKQRWNRSLRRKARGRDLWHSSEYKRISREFQAEVNEGLKGGKSGCELIITETWPPLFAPRPVHRWYGLHLFILTQEIG